MLFDLLLTPAYAPFAVSFAVMVGVGLIEAVGLGMGQFDLSTDAAAGGDTAGALDWLGIGSDIPILIWLMSLLGCFTLAGLMIQQVAAALLGNPLAWPLASAGALVIGGVSNRFVSGGLARIIPGYESTVISVDDLIMRRGTILEGAARRGHPARAKVIDQHKQPHYVMVEPHDDADVIAQGDTGLLVRKEGGIFFILPDTNTTLRSV